MSKTLFGGGSPKSPPARKSYSENLMKQVAQMEMQGETGKKAQKLLQAIKKTNIDKLRKSLTTGSDANLGVDSSGLTPLCLAISKNFLPGVQMLLQNKADPNVPSLTGWFPLHYAAFIGSVEITQSLMEAGANINCVVDANNAKSKKGQTPLHIASGLGFVKVVNCLMDAKARLDIRDKKERTPLDIALTLSVQDTSVEKTKSQTLGKVVSLLLSENAPSSLTSPKSSLSVSKSVSIDDLPANNEFYIAPQDKNTEIVKMINQLPECVFCSRGTNCKTKTVIHGQSDHLFIMMKPVRLPCDHYFCYACVDDEKCSKCYKPYVLTDAKYDDRMSGACDWLRQNIPALIHS